MKNKNTRFLILYVFTLFIFSCSSDDSKGNDQGIEDEEIIEEEEQEEEEETEETGIDASVVFENVIVDGGSKKSGSLSTPNEGITFELVSGSIALPTEGFDIELNSDSELAGAYLRFKNDDGTVADGYYDIDFSALSEDKPFNKSIKRRNSKIKTRLKAAEPDFIVDIDFTSTLEPGTFCYLISVYDAEGNVSKEMEACLKILPWGENDSLAGTWNLTKEYSSIAGDSGSYEIGEEDCNVEETLTCDNSSTLNYHYYCYVTLEGNLILNADGTYFEEKDGIGKRIEEDVSAAECEAIYSEAEDDYYSIEGKWAYDAENSQLIVAEHKFYSLYGEYEDSEISLEGDADVYFYEVEVTDNSLIVYFEETDPDDQDVFSYIDYYTKQ